MLITSLSRLSKTKIFPTWWRRATKKVYSTGSLDKSSSGHQRNLKVSPSFGSTITWWNMASMPEERGTGSWRILKTTPSGLLVKSGPLSDWSLSDVPLYRFVQSNTTCSFPGLLGLKAAYNWLVISWLEVVHCGFFYFGSFSQTNILIHFDNILVQLILTSYTTSEENIPYPRNSVQNIRNINNICLKILLTSTCVDRHAQHVNLITRVFIPPCSGL